MWYVCVFDTINVLILVGGIIGLLGVYNIGLIVMLVGIITLFVLVIIAMSDSLRGLDVKYGCVSS